MPLGLATDGKEAGCRILRQFDGGPASQQQSDTGFVADLF